MLTYIGKRLLQMIPVLLIVAILIFSLMDMVPGDPVDIILGDNATQTQKDEVREQMGLNQPYAVRLFEFLKGILRLDFGKSYINRTSIGDELRLRFPNTLSLAVLCVAFTVVFGIPIGVQCALRADRLSDRIWMFVTMLCNSMPSFWLAMMLIILFSVRLKLLPSNGIGGVEFLILPVLANSMGSLAGIARQTRSSMLEVIRADFVTTARSKGINERDVIWKHALPNAMIPIITSIGARFGMLLGGTTIIESVFSIPGIGLYMLHGINDRDYPVVQGCILYIAFTFSIMMLLTDLVYAFVDPRIKARYIGKKRTGGKRSGEQAGRV